MGDGIREGGIQSVKLFVGQIPKQLSEQQIASIFGEAGNVREINIIKDKLTKQSRGCCFITFGTRQEADHAIALFHDKRTLAPVTTPLQVKYADGELERLEHKLFIGMLPSSVSEADVTAIFLKFGSIKELSVIKGSQSTSKGCAFLKYETKDQAMAAIEALNGVHKMEGSTSALVVKWADTEKERQARRAQKSQATSTIRPPGQQPSLFGAVPVGYVAAPPPLNGYTYQPTNPYGMMPYSVPTLPSQQGIPTGILGPINPQSTVQESPSPELMTQMGNPNFAAIQYASYMTPMYQSYPGIQYPVGYPGTQYGQTVSPAFGTLLSVPSQGTHAGLPVVGLTPAVSGVTAMNTGIAPQTEGPPGANLFIYHIPLEFGDQELSTTFSSFGNVISAKVFVDKATGASKCFGFVSYDSPEAAQAAINVMNGFQLSGKRLKVQLKRDTKQSKPY